MCQYVNPKTTGKGEYWWRAEAVYLPKDIMVAEEYCCQTNRLVTDYFSNGTGKRRSYRSDRFEKL